MKKGRAKTVGKVTGALALLVLALAAMYAAAMFSTGMMIYAWSYFDAPARMMLAAQHLRQEDRFYGHAGIDKPEVPLNYVEKNLTEALMNYCGYAQTKGWKRFWGDFYLNWFIAPLWANTEKMNKDYIIFLAEYRKTYPIGEGYFVRYEKHERKGDKEFKPYDYADSEYSESIRRCWKIIERDAQAFRAQGLPSPSGKERLKRWLSQ